MKYRNLTPIHFRGSPKGYHLDHIAKLELIDNLINTYLLASLAPKLSHYVFT